MSAADVPPQDADRRVSPRSLARVLRGAVGASPELGRGFGWTLLLAVVGTAGQIVVPIAIQQVLDREVLAGDDIDLLAVGAATAVAIAVLLVALAANRVALLRLVHATARGLADLRVRAFRHIHDLSSLHVQAERRGALVARVTSDVEAVNDFLEWGGVGMLVGGAQLVLTITVMIFYEWRLALLVAVAAGLYGALLVVFQRILSRAYDRVRLRVAATLAAMGEAISGLPTIRAYGVEARARGRVDRAVDEQFRAEFRTGALGAAMFSSADLFAGTVTAGVVAAGVAWIGDISAGTLVAFLFLVTLFIDPVQLIVEILDIAQSAAAGLRRVLGLLDTPAEISDPVGGVDLPEGPLDVRVAGLRFRYPTGEDVLHDVSVDIPAGARVAVVGETGSGKTTFAKLVTRLLDPTSGEILVGGVPVNRVRFASLRRRVGFVPQDGFLFDASVADNVRYGRPDATDAEVADAFDDLELADWIAELPRGIHTRVGERGGRLSSGERQLVALARAWIGRPDLLILDEATSAVDPALELRLRRAIERLTEGRTSITIAHRLSTAEAAEEILVFDAGRLVERGAHDDLVAADGTYAALHRDWVAGTAAA